MFVYIYYYNAITAKYYCVYFFYFIIDHDAKRNKTEWLTARDVVG